MDLIFPLIPHGLLWVKWFGYNSLSKLSDFSKCSKMVKMVKFGWQWNSCFLTLFLHLCHSKTRWDFDLKPTLSNPLFPKVSLEESSFLKSQSIWELFNFKKWTHLEHFFLPFERDDSPVYFVLYGYTLVRSFPAFLFPPTAMLEFPAFHVNPFANMEIKNNTSINAVLLTHTGGRFEIASLL